MTINAEALPEVFELTLMGQHHPGEMKYKTGVSGEDRYIDYSAREHEGVWQVTQKRPLIHRGYSQHSGHVLSETELAAVNRHYKTTFTYGRVVGTAQFLQYELRRKKTDEKINEMEKYGDPVRFSQHSAIVMDPNVQEKSVAYDLAIGNCMAFEDPDFWLSLRKRADWRHEFNPDNDVKEYYKTGMLPKATTKVYMNKPDNVLPTGEFGVVNEFSPGSRIIPARYPAISDTKTVLSQWDMPEPASLLDVPGGIKKHEVAI